ncbi:hypothetical protein QBC36DRAFT_289750, partial [Triangularia setosa]
MSSVADDAITVSSSTESSEGSLRTTVAIAEIVSFRPSKKKRVSLRQQVLGQSDIKAEDLTADMKTWPCIVWMNKVYIQERFLARGENRKSWIKQYGTWVTEVDLEK